MNLKKKKLLEIIRNQCKIYPQTIDYLYENYPPNINNCQVFIEYFISLLNPDNIIFLSAEQEKMLLQMIRNIQGNSNEPALLADYYAQYLLKNNKFNSAINFFDLAIEIQQNAEKSISLVGNFTSHLAEAYLQDNQYENALKYAFKTINYSKKFESEHKKILIYNYNIISTIYFRQQKYKSAYKYIINAIELTKEDFKDKKVIIMKHRFVL